jgi:hypothetical protein
MLRQPPRPRWATNKKSEEFLFPTDGLIDWRTGRRKLGAVRCESVSGFGTGVDQPAHIHTAWEGCFGAMGFASVNALVRGQDEVDPKNWTTAEGMILSEESPME